MGDFFTVLWLISLIGLVAGLAKPSLFAFVFKHSTSRKVVGLTLGVVSTVFLLVAGALAKPLPEPAPTPKPQAKETATSTSSPAERFLSEEQKKKIYYEITAVQDRALAEAEAQFPIDNTKPGFKRENIDKYAERNQELSRAYEAKVRKKYGITRDQQSRIIAEGSKKMWPVPSKDLEAGSAKVIADKLVVKSTIVKKVNGRYQYWFDVHNSGSKPATGSVDIIELVVKKPGYSLTRSGTIDLKGLRPGMHQIGHMEAEVGNGGRFGESAVKGFKYWIYIDGKKFEYSEKPISGRYEDTDAY